MNRISVLTSCTLMLWLSCVPQSLPAQDYQQARAELVEEIGEHVRRTARYLGRDRLDERVLEAIASVPRHEFVPQSIRHLAYENRPLPIGHG